jgi:hypothetical protein
MTKQKNVVFNQVVFEFVTSSAKAEIPHVTPTNAKLEIIFHFYSQTLMLFVAPMQICQIA